jgi:hypothetical protein
MAIFVFHAQVDKFGVLILQLAIAKLGINGMELTASYLVLQVKFRLMESVHVL